VKYQITHRTRYNYEGSVTVSHHLARLAPRTLPGQRCPWHELEIRPIPVGRGVHVDSFGNTAAYFEIEGKHETLEVTARSLVEVLPAVPRRPCETPGLGIVSDACHGEKLTPGSDAGAFRFASPWCPWVRISPRSPVRIFHRAGRFWMPSAH
jgi:transglutaminase-like putative cysteine protease